MQAYLQFLTLPTIDTSGTAVLLHFDSRRYIFGRVSEGLQRALIQRGVGLNRVTDLFLTGRAEWASVGGLLGLSLTKADQLKARKGAILQAERDKEKRRAEREEEERKEEEERTRLGKKPRKKPEQQRKGKKDREKNGEAQELEAFRIHGAPNLLHMVASARNFILRTGGEIYIDEFDDGIENGQPGYVDENIKVWPIRLRKKNRPKK
jgi:ribonuclease Z